MNNIYDIDFYKVGHVSQYEKNITQIWSNWTPRYTRTSENGAIHFGLQRFLQKLNSSYRDFFNRPWSLFESQYKLIIQKTLGIKDAKTEHIKQLHDYGRLPLDIYAVPEGTFVPCGVPALVVTNTQPWAFWLPNYIETILSNYLWKPSTSATTAMIYQKIFRKYAKMFGESDLSFTRWQGHDFSFRGLDGLEDAEGVGLGHLTSFSGTDTLPAILAAVDYYQADYDCGGSVPATEHSVMCAGGKLGEFETFERLLTEVYPSGIVSIVSDTWDLWKVLTDFVPRLKSKILARDGKLVIRPDSGDPVKILCGDPDATDGPVRAGAIRLLAEALGVNDNGLINKGGLIYGDSITPERAEAILSRNHNEIKLSPYNLVFGIGSYTYTYCTRDNYGFAMKATAVEKDGKIYPIFKDPVTDDGGKKSHYGIPLATVGAQFCRTTLNPEDLNNCSFEKVYTDGVITQQYSLKSIRERITSCVNRTDSEKRTVRGV